jgi:CheY-like chemotaxis protein
VSQEPAPSPVRERIRVLVAEDNDVNQIVFEQILEAMDVDFRIVANGQEAVAAWTAAAPDLILMDVSMPVMNGLQATQAIRDAEANAGNKPHPVPVIAVTAHAMTGDRERCLAAGMNDYLSKPVSPEKLEAIIEKWVDGPQLLKVAG